MRRSLEAGLFVGAALWLGACVLPEANLIDGSGGSNAGGGAAGKGGTGLTGGTGGSGGSVTGGTGGTGATGATGGTGGSSATGGGGNGGSTLCGNGKIDANESCDGAELGTATCASAVGVPAGGTLGCKTDCSFDTSQCTYCGNGKIDPGEICDGSDVGAHDCKVVATTASGNIGCTALCQLDTSGCTPASANGNLSQYEAGAPWPMFRGGPSHAARSAIIRSKQLKVAWTYPGGYMVTAPAVGGDGTIYFGATDSTNASHLYALNPDGSEKWKLDLPAMVRGTPAIAADGTIYAVTWNGTLFAVSHAGSKKWLYPTGADSLSAPTIGVDGNVYFGSTDGKLRAIKPDGSLGWEFISGAGGPYASTYSVAVAANGNIYAPESLAAGTHLYVLSPAGALLNTATNPAMTECSPLIGIDGTVYFGGNAYAADGTQIWSSGAWGWWGVTLGADGSLYGGGVTTLSLFLPTDGTSPWTSPALGPYNISPPLVAGDGTLFGGGWDPDMVWSLTPNGSLNDQLPIGDNVMDTPSIGLDGTLYVGSGDGKLYAYSP